MSNSHPARLIARLDIKTLNVIKGIHLEGLRVVGKPAELARRYYDAGIDEILYMDSVASLYGRNSILDVVSEAARDIFVPLTVGGGIRTIEDIVAALRAGADKVAINTAAIAHPQFISDAAKAVGSQAVVISIEAQRRPGGWWEAQTNNGREKTEIDVLKWVTEVERLGAGEIIITSIDHEGTRKGFDLELLDEVHKRVRIPVIASGGAGNAEHVVEVFSKNVADAVACASLFHYDLCSIGKVKEILGDNKIKVRL